MTTPARRPATYEDLLAVPDHLVAEIIDGDLYTFPRPAAPHARTSSNLGGELYGPFQRGRAGPGGWVILDEPELHLRGHQHTLEVLRLDGETYRIVLSAGEEERVRAEPFDAIELELRMLWSP
jgi:hypothetical protein